MKRILCYGDSNTWGYRPVTGQRYAANERWTGVLQRTLGNDWQILEEGMNGRTTVYASPLSPGRCGKDYLLPCLVSQKPIDAFIMMLGTNDLYWTDAFGAAAGAASLIQETRIANYRETMKHSPIFPSGERILLISPPLVHESALRNGAFPEYREYCQKAKDFSFHFQKVAEEQNVFFLDAGAIATGAAEDPIHLTAEGHTALGLAVADRLTEMFSK